jgi:hypothetical protein
VKSGERTVVDGFVMSDPIPQEVQFTHGVVDIPAHAPSVDARKGLAQTRKP